jgi:prevent-host-death family protein
MRSVALGSVNITSQTGNEERHELATVELTEARAQLAELFNRAAYGKERIALRRHGKALVALVPIEDARFLEELEDRIDLEKARAALSEAEAQDDLPWERVKGELGL